MAFVDHYIRVYNLNIEEEYFKHSHKKWKHSLERRAELAVLCIC